MERRPSWTYDPGMYKALKEGDLTSTTFKEKGVYPYFCAHHPGMVAAVVVG